jgi:cell division protein FtsI (penicillin-binding protein 3)
VTPAPEARRWADAIEHQAESLHDRFPDATIRLVALDVEGDQILASFGRIDQPHAIGSTVKPFTMAAALDAGVDPAIELDCVSGQVEFGGHEFEDYAAHGRLSLREAMARSSNVAIVRLAQQLGVRDLYRGVAEIVELPALDPLDDAAAVEVLFGASTRLTTTELARGYAMLARGGLDAPGGRQVVPVTIAHAVSGMLEHAVASADGTGHAAAVPGRTVAGKTGTAPGEGDEQRGHTALFVGTVQGPDTPPVVIAVVVEGVDRSHYGGNLAAPAFAAIVREAGG